MLTFPTSVCMSHKSRQMGNLLFSIQRKPGWEGALLPFCQPPSHCICPEMVEVHRQLPALGRDFFTFRFSRYLHCSMLSGSNPILNFFLGFSEVLYLILVNDWVYARFLPVIMMWKQIVPLFSWSLPLPLSIGWQSNHWRNVWFLSQECDT